MTRLHDDEIPIDIELVRRLVDQQFPEYAGESLRALAATGSSNRLFRLGDGLLVRLPRQPGGGSAIEKERDWLPAVVPLPVNVPEIVGVGEPGEGYPEAWAIVRWLEGQHPRAYMQQDGARPVFAGLAEQLADVVLALRQAAVSDDAANDPRLRWYRGRPLIEYDDDMQRTIRHCRSIDGLDLDFDAIQTIWRETLALPGADQMTETRWFHSDLVAENLLLNDGKLTAVLDFGCLSVGDPTIDLHGAWELFDPEARAIFRTRLNVDETTWAKGRAWAVAIGLGALAYYWKTMPARCRDRRAMIEAALADQVSPI